MSYVFSKVSLKTNTNIEDSGFMSGIPDCDEVMKSDLYRELLEDCGGSKYIRITIDSFEYGDGEQRRADYYEMSLIEHEGDEFLNRPHVSFLQSQTHNILHPDLNSGMGMQL